MAYRYDENEAHSIIVNPVTGDELGRVPVVTQGDIDQAVEAARSGFALWSGRTQYQRNEILHRFIELY